MSERIQPVRPELLAAKIESVTNFEQPDLLEEFSADQRLVEALWFLQYVSLPQHYAGGLSKFAADFIADASDLLGTPGMLTAIAAGDRYSARDAVAILKELPKHQLDRLLGDDEWIITEAFVNGRLSDAPGGRVRVERETWGEKTDRWEGSRAKLESRLLTLVTPATTKALCQNEALDSLAEYLKQLCEAPHLRMRQSDSGNGAPWYFAAVADALLRFMDRRAAAIRSTVAETEITRLVVRWMAKARSMKRPIMIIGNSRFGKTEAVRLYAATNPGGCRIVETPATNAIGDFLREVAKALGLEVGAQNNGRDLRERIDYVLRFSSFLLCFDEAQLILPVAYSRNTAPARLNWVRRSVIDQNIGAVFVCTPQSYLPAKKRFVRATGFAMEQFDERLLKTLELPSEASEEDLLAIARIHFPGQREEYLHLVVHLALMTERNFVSDIEKIATLAKDNARENGRTLPILADIKAAIADVLPAAPAAPRKRAVSPKPADPIQAPCRVPATALPESRKSFETLQPNRRQTTLIAQPG